MTALAFAVGQKIVQQGLDRVFGVVGNGNLSAVAGMAAAGATYVAARHEGGAVVMADSYHRVTGELAVCTTTYGPGFTNLLTGLIEAVKHPSGLLVLCGDHPISGRRGIDVDQGAVLSALGVRYVRLTEPATALRDTVQAVETARTTRCPVVLLLPHDLQSVEVDDLQWLEETGSSSPRTSALKPTGADIEAVLDIMEGAKRPLILGGLGAWRADAEGSLIELADRLGALLCTSLLADGMFSSSKWSLGICGGLASPIAKRLIGQADIVLAFGASLNEWTLSGGTMFDPRAQLIRVDVSDAQIPGRVDVPLTGDARLAAEALCAGVQSRRLPAHPWRVEERDSIEVASWHHESYLDTSTAERADPRTLSRALAALLPDKRILVTDGGHFIGWPAMYWQVSDPSARVFTGVASQSIGLGLAGAVGAAVGRPDCTVVLAIGDGGALMGLSELETLIRIADSVLIVVYDDAAYGAEVHLYEDSGVDVDAAVFEDTDFAGIARSLGAAAITVRGVGDLAPLVQWRAAGSPGCLLLDCKIVRQVVASYLADLSTTITGSASRQRDLQSAACSVSES